MSSHNGLKPPFRYPGSMGAFVLITSLLAASGVILAADFTGSSACEELPHANAADFFKNPHYKSIASGKESPRNTGCEGCHGPAGDHLGFPEVTNIRAFSQMPPREILDACLRCHSETLSRSNIRRSSHTQEDVVCTNCHSIHKSATPRNLLAKKQTELCSSCHTSVKAQFSMPFKHRVNEGVVQCTDCHNPHGSSAPTWRMASRPRNTEQVLGNEEPCLKCHVEKRGPFAFEHAAVRVDGCEVCH